MKKKTAIFILFFICIASMGMLSACSLGSTHHTHIFSEEWSYDDTNHWHGAVCAHMSEKADAKPHVFDSGTETDPTFESPGYVTYVCTVCGYEKRTDTSPALEHNYSDTLTHDGGDTHWYACTDEGYEYLKKGEEKHLLTETSFDEATGYATYLCECGFSKQYLRTSILTLPSVNQTVYIGQKLSDVSLSGGEGSVDGSFSWSSPDTVITQSGNYNVTFSPTDTEYAPVSGSVAITAVQLTVTVSAEGNGACSEYGEINVDFGGSLTIVFTPDAGFAVGTLEVDGITVTPEKSVTLDNITADRTVKVTFVERSMLYTITCVSGTENAYTVLDDTLTFTSIDTDTVYSISGEFEGNIVIDVDQSGTYKFDLELTGFTLTCDYTNPITILSGNEVSITAKNGTENFIYDNREEIDPTDDALYSAAVYSTVDLEICGKGTLTVVSANNDGIHTKDDLQVKNLTLSVTAKDNALKGNDSVEITNATTTLIASAGDCIKTTNSHINENTSKQKGSVSVAGGTHNLYAACDGIDAAYNVLIEDSSTVINIYTDKYSEYSEEVTAISDGNYYLRYTSTAYRYSVKYYNGDEDYLWVNVGDAYEKVTSSGGRPGAGGTTYYYYSFAKKTGYSKMTVYMYSSSQAQGQDTDYYACSENNTVNTSYDTLALSLRSGILSVNWTNYTTTSSPGGMGGMGGMQEGNTDKGSYSTKGIKAANEITINAGTINVKSYDDAIHAGDSALIDAGTPLENGILPTGNLNVNGGTLTLYSNDDGLHAGGTLLVTGETVTVTNAYEGLEGKFIRISGGNVSVISSDDGFNGTTSSGAGIEISGGSVYVKAGGDGLDSNSSTSKGAILFSGGDVVVISTSNGNSAIDTDGGYSHTGGRVLAVMPSGGMTSETTNGNTTGRTVKSSLSLSSGGYVTVSVGSETVVTVKMPCSLTAYAVYLGDSGATIASASDTSFSLNPDGVFWLS